jgi:hypothetical protein
MNEPFFFLGTAVTTSDALSLLERFSSSGRSEKLSERERRWCCGVTPELLSSTEMSSRSLLELTAEVTSASAASANEGSFESSSRRFSARVVVVPEREIERERDETREKRACSDVAKKHVVNKQNKNKTKKHTTDT